MVAVLFVSEARVFSRERSGTPFLPPSMPLEDVKTAWAAGVSCTLSSGEGTRETEDAGRSPTTRPGDSGTGLESRAMDLAVPKV